MSWFGTEIDGPLILTRTLQFAAAATAGVLIFRTFVGPGIKFANRPIIPHLLFQIPTNEN